MKQLKFFLVAILTIIIGGSVTSCMNTDSDPIYTDLAIAKATSFISPTFQLANGQKLVVTNATADTYNEGQLYVFYYQYNTEEQAWNAPTLNVTLYQGSTPTSISAKSAEGPVSSTSATAANAPLYTVEGYVAGLGEVNPMLYTNEFLILPLVYWVANSTSETELATELNKHSFIVNYDIESLTSTNTELVLTVNHVVDTSNDPTDLKRDKYTYTTKAYSLSNAVSAFHAKTGNYPLSIKVKAITNITKNSLNSQDGAKEESSQSLPIKFTVN